MRKVHLDIFLIGDRIYAGCLLAGENAFEEARQEVTGRACAAVAQRVIDNGGTLVFHDNQGTRYELTAKETRP